MTVASALVAAAATPRIVVRPGPIVVHASPVTVHTSPVVQTTDTTATVIAAVGVLLALGALGWQAWTFQRLGSRVRVGIARGLAGAGHATTIPWDATPSQLRQMHSQGYTAPIYVVTASNSGRGEASVVSADVLLPGGGSVSETLLDPPLPFRLSGLSEQSWRFDGRLVDGYMQVFDASVTADKPRVAHGRIRLGGSEKSIVSKGSVQL